MTLCLVINIGTENKKNCEAKRIFHYSGGSGGISPHDKPPKKKNSKFLKTSNFFHKSSLTAKSGKRLAETKL